MSRSCIWLLLCLASSSLAQNPNPVPEPAPAVAPNFFGTWKLDMGRSTFPRAVGPHYGDLPEHAETDFIDYEDPVMEITPHIDHRDVMYGLFCRTDGQGPQGLSANRQQRCDGHWNGATFVYDTKSRRPDGASEHVVLELSEDGLELTKRVHITWPGGGEERTFVFTKLSTVRGGVSLGDTLERVKHQQGEPDKVIEEGKLMLLIYGDLDYLFVGGKLANIVGGAFIGDRAPVYPGDVQFGWTRDQVVQVYKEPMKAIQLNGSEIDFYSFSALAYSGGKLTYMSETGQTEAEARAIFGPASHQLEWKRKRYEFYPFMLAIYAGDRLIYIQPNGE